MTIESSDVPGHLLSLDKREFVSYQLRKEAYIHKLLDRATEELTHLYPFDRHPLVPARDVARVYLAGQFAADEMLEKFAEAVNTISESHQLDHKSLPINIQPDFIPSQHLAGIANPTFTVGDKQVTLFTLHPEKYEQFLQNLSDTDVPRVEKVDISLNILYIINQLKLLPTSFVEADTEETAVHELGHALYFLSANTNPPKMTRLVALLKAYPHPSKMKIDDETIMQKYNNSYLEKQARRWENYLFRYRR